MDPARLVADLNDAQRAAVTSTAAPLCILAGAGSGKTRTLTRRIGHRVATGDADPRHVLALTFTRKAAGELGSRLRALGMRDTIAAGTFHSIAYAQLRNRWDERGIRPPDLIDRKVRFLVDNVRLPPKTQAIDVVSEIEWAMARRIEPDDYVSAAARAARTSPVAPDLVARIYAEYMEAKLRRRVVDFDDLLRLSIRDLADAEFAAAQRWRFRHLFVDEFQDVNPLQFDLLRAWLGDRADLCVVGDPNQAIYAWNGADAGYLVDFERWFPGADTVELADNYRSSPQVLAVANAVLAPSRPQSAPLRPHRPDGPLPVVDSYATDDAEANGVARAVRDAHRPGGRWSDQAVLTRTNAQTALVGEALRAAGIPHRVRGGVGLLQQGPVRTALAGMRRHSGPFSTVIADLAATIEPDDSGPDGPDRDTTAVSGDDTAVRGDDAATHSSSPDDDPATDTSDAVAERRAALEMLVRLAHDYERIDPVPSVEAFVQWLRATVGNDSPDRDAVDVTTFHAAKGLEWPVVHIAGVEQGLVPIGHAKTASALAEERRLLYVAITRAEQRLQLSWAEERTFGERKSSRQVSPYVADVEHALELLSVQARPPTDWASYISAERARLGTDDPRTRRRRKGGIPADLDPDDEALFEALRSWRSTRAKAAKVPAFVIFSDATLVAVAGSRPRTKAQLMALPGIGPVKVERHGDELLDVITEHSG